MGRAPRAYSAHPAPAGRRIERVADLAKESLGAGRHELPPTSTAKLVIRRQRNGLDRHRDVLLEFGEDRGARFGPQGKQSQQEALQDDTHGGLIRREFVDDLL